VLITLLRAKRGWLLAFGLAVKSEKLKTKNEKCISTRSTPKALTDGSPLDDRLDDRSENSL